MTVQELYDHFRSVAVDTELPYLWADENVFAYMNDAYRMFVRLTGGIADFSSPATQTDIVAGDAVGVLDKSILRVMGAYRLSDMGEIKVINQTDLTFTRNNDYGLIRPIYLDTTPGQVRYMIIGAERGKCKWVQVPEVNDSVQLYIYRLPLDVLTEDNADAEITEVAEEHHIHLVDWMRHMAYRKADAEAFDRGRSDEFGAVFRTYCAETKAEWERYKHKSREVAYGGI